MGVDCASDSLIDSCGTSCVRCTEPANGIATCDGKSCGVLCNPGYQACGDACVNLQADSTNCGTCAHDCQGGACSAGQCQPVELLTNLPHLSSIAIDATKVYLGMDGEVETVPLAGGSLTTLQTGAFGEGITVNATTLFTATYNDDTVLGFPIGGGGMPTTLTSSTSEPFGVTVDATSIYCTGFRGTVLKVPLQGGSPTTLYTSVEPASQAIATGIAVDTRGIYFAMDGTILTMPLTGGTPTLLATVANEPFGLAVDDAYVYWTILYGGTVSKAPLAGGSSTFVANSDTYGTGVAVNATSIYFAADSTHDAGSLWRLAK